MVPGNILDRLRANVAGDTVANNFWINLEAYVAGRISIADLYESMFNSAWLGNPFKDGFYGVVDSWRDKRHQKLRKHSPHLVELLSNEGHVTRIDDILRLAQCALGLGIPQDCLFQKRKDLALVDLVMSLILIRITSQVKKMPKFDSEWLGKHCQNEPVERLYHCVLDAAGNLKKTIPFQSPSGSGNIPQVKQGDQYVPVPFRSYNGRLALTKFDQKNRVHILLKCILKGFMDGFDPQLHRLNDIVRGAIIPKDIDDAPFFCSMLEQAGFTDFTPVPEYNQNSSEEWWRVNAWKYVWESQSEDDPTAEVQVLTLKSHYEALRSESTMSHDAYAKRKWDQLLPMLYPPDLYWGLTIGK